MFGTLVSAVGIALTGVGTFIRVIPDVDRRIRRHFYTNAPFTRDVFRLRQEIKESQRGMRFTVRSPAVRKEFIDYVDAHGIRDPPDQVPVSITNVASSIEATMPGGSSIKYLRGGGYGQSKLVGIVTQALERKCRNNGLIIAIIGALLTIAGTIV